MERHETVVIGGGQAGLATGYHLRRRGRQFVILDAAERVGDAWRERWPSLKLYTPAKLDALPGLKFPAPKFSYPSANEMADYLETYAERFELPVESGVRVDGLSLEGGRYVVTAGERQFEADNAVVATGVMQKPVRPDFAAELDSRITQLHSYDYRSPAQLRPGPVLVVGASHSGGDIAYELAGAGFETVLSGRDTGQFPVSIESRRAQLASPVLKLLATRVLTMSTPIGRKLRPEIRAHGAPLLRYRKADLESAGVERVFERTVGVQDGKPVLADGRVLDVSNVVWCTGFRNDFGWIRVPFAVDADGYPEQYRGAVPSAPGLYFVGLLFQHSFSSMLVLGAGRDAEWVVRHLVSRAGAERGAGTEAEALAGGVAA